MFRYITHPFATRHQDYSRAAVRLACVKHAASVQSEPGSNSSVQSLAAILSPGFNTQTDLTQSEFTFMYLRLVWVTTFMSWVDNTIYLRKQYYSSSVHIPTLIDCFIWILKNFFNSSSTAVASKRCALYRLKWIRQLYFFTHRKTI